MNEKLIRLIRTSFDCWRDFLNDTSEVNPDEFDFFELRQLLLIGETQNVKDVAGFLLLLRDKEGETASASELELCKRSPKQHVSFLARVKLGELSALTIEETVLKAFSSAKPKDVESLKELQRSEDLDVRAAADLLLSENGEC